MKLTKTLLLAGSVPGAGHVGEIILRDIVRHVGIDSICCAAAVSPRYKWHRDESIEGLQVEVFTTVALRAQRWGDSKLGAVGSLAHHFSLFPLHRAQFVRKAVQQGKTFGVSQVFAVLNNAMMFSAAHRVASRLGVPLLTLVWDPPEYLLHKARFDRVSRSGLLRDFRTSLARSTRIAVVSETMQEDYRQHTRSPIQILRHGVASARGQRPLASSRSEWILGFAGSMYSNCAWSAFLRALDSASWVIAGRPVRLRVLSARIEAQSRSLANIEYLGFRSTSEVQRLLAECDACYLPQPFVRHLASLSRYSFPTKLTNYMALGVPVLVHAPTYGALTPFLQSYPVGVQVDSLCEDAIIRALERLLLDATFRESASTAAMSVAESLFSISSFRHSIDALLGPSTA